MNRRIPSMVALAFATALSLEGCWDGPTREEGTSSETQTALQMLADNIPLRPGSRIDGLTTAAASARKAGATTPSYLGCYDLREQPWIFNSPSWNQVERFQPQDSLWNQRWVWISQRVDQAHDAWGNPMRCGLVSSMSARMYMDFLSRDGVFGSFDGFFTRDTTVGGMSRLSYAGTLIYPSGFIMTETVVERVYSQGIFGLVTSVVSEDLRFGNGRYQIGPDVSDPDSSKRNRIASCRGILDLARANRRIGTYCELSGGISKPDLVQVYDELGNPVPARILFGSPLPDSTGLQILSVRHEQDSLQAVFRLKMPHIRAKDSAWTRLEIGCHTDSTDISSPVSSGITYTSEIGQSAVERGAVVAWSLPWKSQGKVRCFLTITRNYPLWNPENQDISNVARKWVEVGRTKFEIPAVAK